MKKNNMIMTIVAVIVVGLLAFFAGMQYQKMQRGNFGGTFGTGQNRQFGNGQGGTLQGRMGTQGSRPVNGEILNMDDKSITVKMPDGSTKIIILSEKTTINKASEISKSDLKTGDTIAVFGTQNADGSMTAQNVSIGGMFRGMKGSASPSGQPKN